MTKLTSFQDHISNAQSLVTSYEETRAGFVSIALERNRQATPYITEARILKDQALLAKTPQELIKNTSIRNGLIAAAGISDKASGHLGVEGQDEAVKGLIKNFLEPAGANFAEELVFRFLLTRGDTLGGSMRNLVGVFSQRKLTTNITAALSIAGIHFSWMHNQSKVWFPQEKANPNDIEMARGISWTHNGKNRTLLYNIKVPLFGNNVDLCLFDCTPEIYKNDKIHLSPEHYIALGELKGGIDPAGADEHWKTAKTALDRIYKAFQLKNLSPKLFFIGAAVESKMSQEIWADLNNGKLANAANLTKTEHLTSLCIWLTNL